MYGGDTAQRQLLSSPNNLERDPLTYTIQSWWMDELFCVLFNTISVISRRWKGEHERLCAKKRRLGSGRISPPAGFELATPWSEVGSANRSARRFDWVCSWQLMTDAISLSPPSPMFSENLAFKKVLNPTVPGKRPDNVKITRLYRCTGRLFAATTWHNDDLLGSCTLGYRDLHECLVSLADSVLYTPPEPPLYLIRDWLIAIHSLLTNL